MPYLTQEEQGMLTWGMDKMMAVGGIIPAVSFVAQASTSLFNILQTKEAVDTISTAKPFVYDYLKVRIDLAAELKKQSISEIGDLVRSDLHSNWSVILNHLVKGMWQGVGALHASTYEKLTATDALMQAYNGIVQRTTLDPYITRWANSTIMPNLVNSEAAWFLARLGWYDSDKMNQIAAYEGWDKENFQMLNQTYYKPLPMGMLLEAKRRGFIGQDSFNYWLKFYRLADDQVAIMNQLLTAPLEPYRAADINAKGWLSDDVMHTAFQAWGLDTPTADAFRNAAYSYPSMGILNELYWRTQITDAQWLESITHTGMPPALITAIKDLRNQIPAAQDIITMVIREAFEPANILTAPAEFNTWMAKKGYSAYWNDKYWTAHFLPMPLNQAYDNLRRGYWTEAQMKELLRIADIHPRWHDDILKVAYRPPSIRELGYGYDTSIYTFDDIVTYRRWSGLAPDIAVKAAQALVEYRLEPERRSLRSAYMNQYMNGIITRDQFATYLTNLKTNADASKLWLEHADAEIALKSTQVPIYETRTMTRADAEWLYINGVKDANWFTAQLKALGYLPQAVTDYLAMCDAKIAKAKEPTVAKREKELSLAEIRELYQAKLMDLATTTARLTAMNYLPTDIPLIIEIWDKVKPASVKRLTVAEHVKLFHDGVITADQLLVRIINMGYTTADANDIVSIATKLAVRAKAVPQLTEADLERLYRYGYYSADTLAAEFVKRGLSQQDALLKTYTITLAIEIPMLKEQYKDAWIDAYTLAQDITALIQPFNSLGNTTEIVDNIMMTIVKNTAGARIAKERDLTKAEIIKGAKNQVLTPAQAVEMLVAMGYSTSEANYLLAINKIVIAGDPKGYWEMRQTVELHKEAMGQKSVVIPDELITLEAQVRDAKKNIDTLKGISGKEGELSEHMARHANTLAQIETIKSKMQIKATATA